MNCGTLIASQPSSPNIRSWPHWSSCGWMEENPCSQLKFCDHPEPCPEGVEAIIVVCQGPFVPQWIAVKYKCNGDMISRTLMWQVQCIEHCHSERGYMQSLVYNFYGLKCVGLLEHCSVCELLVTALWNAFVRPAVTAYNSDISSPCKLISC